MINLRAFIERQGALLESPGTAADTARRDRIARWALAVAIVVYALLALYVTRGSVPYYDGMAWLLRASDGFSPSILLEPHNGHLIALTRVLYAGGLRVFGPEQVVFQVFQIVAVSASATLVFVLLRRRMDSLLALAPTLVFLLLGSTTVLVDPNVAVFAQSTALGLGALLALDRGDRIGDAIACLLLLLGVLAFSLGVPFALGAAFMIAFTEGSLRRAWIVAVPLACYAAWVIWAQKFDAGGLEFGGGGPETGSLINLLLAPNFALDSIAAALAGAFGLGRDLIGPANLGLLDVGWGRILALGAVALVAFRGFRYRPGLIPIALVLVLLSFWVLGAMNFSAVRLPGTERYAYPAVALGAIVLAEALPRDLRVTRAISCLAIAWVLFALPGNLFALRTNGENIRTNSAEVKADLAVAELERDNIDPAAEVSPTLLHPVTVARYLALSDEYGSLAWTQDELLAQPDVIRQWADASLLRLLDTGPVPYEGPLADCSTMRAEGGALDFELPAGGALLRSAGGGQLHLRRFADTPTSGFRLPATGAVQLELPADASPQPWEASIEGAGAIRVCPIPTGGGA